MTPRSELIVLAKELTRLGTMNRAEAIKGEEENYYDFGWLLEKGKADAYEHAAKLVVELVK